MYEHQPKFEAFKKGRSLPFKPFGTYGKDQQEERHKLVKALIKQIWAPERLAEAAK